MKTDYQQLIPEDFSDTSRIWIYQCNRLFTLQEVLSVETILEDFIKEWKTHGVPVKGFATVFFGQFIILMADEVFSGVSGCSTDSSVRMIKMIESTFGVSLFERTQLAFLKDDRVQLLPLQQIKYALDNGFLFADTLFFDHSVQTKSAFLTSWIKPIKDSWLTDRFSL